MGRFGILLWLTVVLGEASTIPEGSSKEDQREVILKELVEIWRKGGGWYPRREQPSSEGAADQQIRSVVRGIVGSLKSLGLFPKKAVPPPDKPLDRNRLSGFLYNISTYLQEMSAELDDGPSPFGDDQFWENLLLSFLQSDGRTPPGQWDGRVPPRPSFKLQDLFLSLRGSPHWDGLLGLVQSILTLIERQPQKPILAFVSQHWKTISALLDTVLQTLVSGTYGQASAGLQGFICVLNGRSDCAFNLSWLQQLLTFLETKNWKPVVNLHPTGVAADHRDGALSTGRFKPFSVPPEVLREENLYVSDGSRETESLSTMQKLLLQALSRSNVGERAVQFAENNPALLQGLDGLRRGLLHRVGNTVYSNLKRKVSRVTMALLDDLGSMVEEPQSSHQGRCSVGDLRQLILWGIRHNLTWNAQAMGFTSQGLPSRPPFMSCASLDKDKSSPRQSTRRSRLLQPQPTSSGQADSAELSASEILEAACNASIPGLTGVSNFTVYLYCNLFDGGEATLDPEVSHAVPDLHASCSNAAWYLSAAEDDFLWVHVCSEFFAQEFNNTVCANSSFWLQRAHQAALSKDVFYLNQSSIDDLCLQLSADSSASSAADDTTEDCLVMLSTRSLSAHDFRRCFLPNDSALISALCGNGSSPLPQEGWASEYCSKVLPRGPLTDPTERPCDFSGWTADHFANSSMLELCGDAVGLRDYVCGNVSRYLLLVRKQPLLLDYCKANLEPKQDRKCVLQQLFDMLPAPYEFDTSQLCVNPMPILQEALYKLSLCEGVVDERAGWLATVSYVLRVLDFVVGLSAGLEEGEREVRQGLGQAILLSSLLDNASFWATLKPDASVSVLQTVGVFLRRERNPSLKEDLLSCFSPVLWDLIEKEDNSSALKFLIQEYLQMPRESIRSLVLSAEKDAVKRFLSHVHQSWDQLQVETIQTSSKEQEAMETMTAAFIHKFPRVTPELFVDLSQFIPYMSVSDIMSFPASLIVNDSVLMAIRDHSSEMKSPQKQAFAKRLLQSSVVGDVPSWPPYFLTSILPLLPHLPVSHFQQLTSQQLSPLMEFLANSSLDATRGRHVLRTLYSKRKNLTSETVMRLGILMCYLNSEELHRFLSTSPVSPALWQQLARCVSEGHVSESGRLSHWLGLTSRTLNTSIWSSSELASLHGVLPQLGASFFQTLSSSELLELFSIPGIPTFPPAQAFQVLSRIAQDTKISARTLCRLRPLWSGLAPAFLRNLSAPDMMGTSDCQCWSSLLTDPQPAHRAMVYRAVQQALEYSRGNITLYLHCLLPVTPLKKLATELSGHTVIHHLPVYRNMAWSHQQAQLLFKMIQQTENITIETVLRLGRIASGMSCNRLRLWANESDFSELLQFVTELPGGLRPALRKCVVEELRSRPKVDPNGFSPSFAAGLPVMMMERLSNASLWAILNHVRRHFIDFLQLPRHKQMAWAEKAIDVLGISEDHLSGTSMDLLGPLLFFLDRDALAQLDREALKLRLEDLRQYCMPSDSFREMAALLTERRMLGLVNIHDGPTNRIAPNLLSNKPCSISSTAGEPKSWTVGDVEHLGRLVFTLSPQQIRSLPLDDLGKDTVEQILQSQWRWEDSALGKVCTDLKGLTDKIYGLIHKIVKGPRWTRREPTPSCADVRGTFPSAWRWYQLARMKRRELEDCVGFMGQDGSLDPEQRRALWAELRPLYKPVKALQPEQLLELGCIVTEMGERELQAANLSDLAVVAYLGSFKEWSTKKMRAALQGIMRRRKRKPEELDVVELASLGHLLCGFSSSEISRLDPSNLSVAALFLRETVLPCSEDQTAALTARLSSPLGFGLVSSWGSEVFTEIGTLAAGLDDMVLSALVKEQMEGLTPAAIALIPPRKMAVVFSAAQLSWLTAEQAWAVTEEQWEELDSEQKQALSMAQYEGEVMLGHRGRNRAPSVPLPDSLAAWAVFLLCTLWHLL